MATSRERIHQLVDELPPEAMQWLECALEQWRAGARARVEHIGIWVGDLDRARTFYERWFGARAGARYSSARRPLETYFLTLSPGARLELMTSPGEPPRLAHVAVRLGSRKAVDRLVDSMRAEGVSVPGMPRESGDGYYEAVAADPDGNLIELLA
jgi:lactoylglutathione lyase